MSHNPLHEIIRNQILKPELDKITYEAEGRIMEVDYTRQRVDVKWVDKLGVARTSKSLHIPQGSQGVYDQGLKIGQKVKLGFTNGDSRYPYVSIIYQPNMAESRYYSRGGAGIPKGMNIIFGGE
jgi:hypothetical protein